MESYLASLKGNLFFNKLKKGINMRKAYRSLNELSAQLKALDLCDRESDFTADETLQAINGVFSLSEDSSFYGAWVEEANVVFAFDEKEMSPRSLGVLISKRLNEIGIRGRAEISEPYLPKGRHDTIKYVNVNIKRG